MYKLIGADGKEYGPITADQLRQWMKEGRVNAQTKVLPEGGTEWKSLGEIPELAAAMPPPPSVLQSAPAYAGGNAESMVKGPAIFILVLAILDILASIFGMVWVALGHTMMQLPNMPQQDVEVQQKIMMLFSLPSYVIGILIAIVCLIGAIRMMKLKNYGLAMTTAILTLIPCGACCCLLNIGAGIWALIVLSKPEVKAAFSQ